MAKRSAFGNRNSAPDTQLINEIPIRNDVALERPIVDRAPSATRIIRRKRFTLSHKRLLFRRRVVGVRQLLVQVVHEERPICKGNPLFLVDQYMFLFGKI